MSDQRARGKYALVEMVIAIGVLAIVSVFVLEMYVRAVNLGNRARDRDTAFAEAQAAIELYKAWGTLDALPPETWDRPVSAVGPQVFEVFYDDAFVPTNRRVDKGYVLTFSVTPGAVDGVSDGHWEDLSVSVVKLSPYLMAEEDQVEICRLHAGAYWPLRAGGLG